MSSAKLHIEGGRDRPKAIKYYLDLIDQREYDSVEEVMADAYVEYDLTHPKYEDREIGTKNMASTLWRLGLVENKQRQTLTDLGHQLVDVILYNEEHFYDLLHLVYSTAYYRNPSPDRAISWSYYQMSRFYRDRSPTDFSADRQEAVEVVTRRAKENNDSRLNEHGSLATRSLNGYRRFIEQLNPPVFNDSSNGNDFALRTFAKKPLVLGAIDALYRSKYLFQALDYGDLLELSDRVSELLGTILLIDNKDLTDVIEHTASMDSRLDIVTDFSLRIRLGEPVKINDLA